VHQVGNQYIVMAQNAYLKPLDVIVNT